MSINEEYLTGENSIGEIFDRDIFLFLLVTTKRKFVLECILMPAQQSPIKIHLKMKIRRDSQNQSGY